MRKVRPSFTPTAIGFVAFTLIVYFTDKFTYQRRLRKLKGGSGQHFQK